MRWPCFILSEQCCCDETGLHGPVGDYAQEKPDLEEQPESAPAGIVLDEALAKRKLDAEIFFFTLALLHWLQVTVSSDVAEVRIFSNAALQSRHWYS